MKHGREFVTAVLLLGLSAGVVCGIIGCSDERSPTKTAYSDGFEVIVVGKLPNGQIRDARSLLLTEGESLVTADPNATFLLPIDAHNIQERLRSNEKQREDLQVNVVVVGPEAGPQDIEVSYSYSNRSFTYAYRTDGKNVWPSWSGSKDLSGQRKVTYVANHS